MVPKNIQIKTFDRSSLIKPHASEIAAPGKIGTAFIRNNSSQLRLPARSKVRPSRATSLWVMPKKRRPLPSNTTSNFDAAQYSRAAPASRPIAEKTTSINKYQKDRSCKAAAAPAGTSTMNDGIGEMTSSAKVPTSTKSSSGRPRIQAFRISTVCAHIVVL